MAVAIIATDTWIQHLPFVGGPRTTPFGQVDGVWYGLVAGDGDASGGNLTLNGQLSFDRKEDWVYIFGGISSSLNAVVSQDVFTLINTGPLIPTPTAVQNPSFHRGGLADPIDSNAITISELNTGGADPRHGMPIFGDKRIPGVFLMCAVGWEANTNGATHQMSCWGWMIRYNSFFRDTPPRLG